MQPPKIWTKTKASLLAKNPKDIRGHMRLLDESLSLPTKEVELLPLQISSSSYG